MMPEGECRCCGQLFLERTRVMPGAGVWWTGVLGRHAQVGVCPRCHNEYGVIRGFEEPWSEDDWRAYHAERIARVQSSSHADVIALELDEDFPYLAAQARSTAEWLRQVEAAREVDELVRMIHKETSVPRLERLAAEIHLRWPDLAEEATIKAVGLQYVEELRREQDQREEEDARRKRDERRRQLRTGTGRMRVISPAAQEGTSVPQGGVARHILGGAMTGALVGAPLAIVVSAGSCLMDLPGLVSTGAAASAPPLSPLWIVLLAMALGMVLGATRQKS